MDQVAAAGAGAKKQRTLQPSGTLPGGGGGGGGRHKLRSCEPSARMPADEA